MRLADNFNIDSSLDSDIEYYDLSEWKEKELEELREDFEEEFEDFSD